MRAILCSSVFIFLTQSPQRSQRIILKTSASFAPLRLYSILIHRKVCPEKSAIQRQIDATNRQIDELVYELGVYHAGGVRLGEGERMIIERNTV